MAVEELLYNFPTPVPRYIPTFSLSFSYLLFQSLTVRLFLRLGHFGSPQLQWFFYKALVSYFQHLSHL